MDNDVRFKTAKEVASAEFLPARTNEDDIFDVEEPDAFSRIRAFCESDDASGMLGIYRCMPNRKEQFICKIDIADFDPEYIKGRFGGGEFRVKAYDGKSRLKLNQSLSIEGDPIIERQAQTGMAVVQNQSQALDIGQLMAAMQESNKQLLMGLVQVLQPQQQNNSRADMLNEMLTMKELFSNGNQGGDSTSMLLKGIELAKSLTPIEGGTTSGMDVLMETIKNFGLPIAQMMSQEKTRQAQPRHVQKQPHSAPLQLEGAPVVPTPQQAEQEQNDMLKYYLSMLCAHAAAGKDPQLYADLVADNLNEQQAAQLLSLPDVVAYMGGINPDVLAHRAWFEALVGELKIIYGLTPENSADTVLQNQPGNEIHASDKLPKDDQPAT